MLFIKTFENQRKKYLYSEQSKLYTNVSVFNTFFEKKIVF